jgi:hypothetical protein
MTALSDSMWSVRSSRYSIRVPNNVSAQVHPIPTFDNLTAFNLMLDKMEDLGLWLMYDMRW